RRPAVATAGRSVLSDGEPSASGPGVPAEPFVHEIGERVALGALPARNRDQNSLLVEIYRILLALDLDVDPGALLGQIVTVPIELEDRNAALIAEHLEPDAAASLDEILGDAPLDNLADELDERDGLLGALAGPYSGPGAERGAVEGKVGPSARALA